MSIELDRHGTIRGVDNRLRRLALVDSFGIVGADLYEITALHGWEITSIHFSVMRTRCEVSARWIAPQQLIHPKWRSTSSKHADLSEAVRRLLCSIKAIRRRARSGRCKSK